MSSYIKQLSVSKSLMKGENFPEMMKAIKAEASKPEWNSYGTVKEVREAETFSHICKAMGIYLIYEGNDMFTVDVNGAYVSSFFIPMLLCVAPFMNDGEIFVQIESHTVLIAFKDGEVYKSER